MMPWSNDCPESKSSDIVGTCLTVFRKWRREVDEYVELPLRALVKSQR